MDDVGTIEEVAIVEERLVKNGCTHTILRICRLNLDPACAQARGTPAAAQSKRACPQTSAYTAPTPHTHPPPLGPAHATVGSVPECALPPLADRFPSRCPHPARLPPPRPRPRPEAHPLLPNPNRSKGAGAARAPRLASVTATASGAVTASVHGDACGASVGAGSRSPTSCGCGSAGAYSS